MPLAVNTITASPVHQVMRSPGRVAAASGETGLGTGRFAVVEPVSSMIMTDGCGVGAYTAVVVSDTATTFAPVLSLTSGSCTYFRSGVSSSLAGRSSVTRRLAAFGQASSTDTADELAAADFRPHRSGPGLPGL